MALDEEFRWLSEKVSVLDWLSYQQLRLYSGGIEQIHLDELEAFSLSYLSTGFRVEVFDLVDEGDICKKIPYQIVKETLVLDRMTYESFDTLQRKLMSELPEKMKFNRAAIKQKGRLTVTFTEIMFGTPNDVSNVRIPDTSRQFPMDNKSPYNGDIIARVRFLELPSYLQRDVQAD